VPQAYRVAWRYRDDETKRTRLREVLESALGELEAIGK
jgi:hypothetical protein